MAAVIGTLEVFDSPLVYPGISRENLLIATSNHKVVISKRNVLKDVVMAVNLGSFNDADIALSRC